jgi:hypothetical protein
LESLPDVNLRHAYPLAALEATLLNIMGGKPDEDAKPKDPGRLYTPFDRLPWFARPEWTGELQGNITEVAALDFMRNRKRLPAWAITVAPIEAIKRAIA